MNEDEIENLSPGAFDLDANLLRSNLPLFFFSVESLDRQFSGTTVAASAWRREKRDRGPGPKGYGPFIDPRIPDTSGRHTGHVRYLLAGYFCSKNSFS